ncbi:hypothetical protein Ddye_012737 [Dipteronia dyeriana]|uniref:Reverse transcriptase domain-containing protein n=1 Tax=Dipteronia dyeriana TaxID=168575 RepID=A0AAD9X542_9ROSI|nr:hypothetical protein Ddye_012737 [Dipteronia dyeriana]
MNAIVWNARGLGSDQAFQVLLKFKQDYSPSIVFFMEIIANHKRMEALRIKLGFVGLTGFYGHPDPGQRCHAWALLCCLQGMYHLLWPCLGDFNEILSDKEKIGGSVQNRSLMTGFQEALDFYGLEGMGFLGRLSHGVTSVMVMCQHWNDWIEVAWCPTKVLASWNQSNRSSLSKETKSKRDELRVATDNIQPGSWNRIKEIETQLDDLLAYEEVYWKQRSRVEWLKEEDRNTRFFHMKAFDRKTRNRIQGLFDNSEEIRVATFTIAPTKASGSDGLPGMFYHKFCDAVGSSVVSACLRCLNNGEPLDAIYNTLVVLILKVKNEEHMNDFLPISLYNVIYKIVSMALVNQLRSVIGEVVSESQSAFIPGRLVSDNAIIVFWCLHALRYRKHMVRSMALKLDMSKVYDRVELGFLDRMMHSLGFLNKWVEMVISCVSSVAFSFLIYGEVYGKLEPSRGLQQGDPLSPYLFLLCTEGLSCVINLAVTAKTMNGFSCIRNSPNISYLFFTDDSLLFSRATDSDCATIRKMIDTYAAASGQAINFDKFVVCVSRPIP